MKRLIPIEHDLSMLRVKLPNYFGSWDTIQRPLRIGGRCRQVKIRVRGQFYICINSQIKLKSNVLRPPRQKSAIVEK